MTKQKDRHKGYGIAHRATWKSWCWVTIQCSPSKARVTISNSAVFARDKNNRQSNTVICCPTPNAHWQIITLPGMGAIHLVDLWDSSEIIHMKTNMYTNRHRAEKLQGHKSNPDFQIIYIGRSTRILLTNHFKWVSNTLHSKPNKSHPTRRQQTMSTFFVTFDAAVVYLLISFTWKSSNDHTDQTRHLSDRCRRVKKKRRSPQPDLFLPLQQSK